MLNNKLTITKYYDNEDNFTKPVLSSLSSIFQSNAYLNNISFLKYNNTKNIGLANINGIIYEINNIPDNLTVNGYLYLRGCTSLISLPDNLTVNSDLYLSHCTSLISLPDNLIVDGYLFLSGCTSLIITDDRYKKLQKQVKYKIYN